jgi:nucleotide-binding universal stress UspA family protein
MLSDVLVPLLTYPDVTAVDVAAMLPDFVAGFAAHVTFLPVEVDVPDLSNRWGASLIALPQMIADVEARSRQAAHQLKQATIAAKGSVTIHHQMVRVALGQTGPALLPFTRYHDLCLLPTSAGSAEKAMLAETIIFGSGRPVMVAPERDLGAYDLGAVAIGWDGGSCASRAVFDALPILAKARTVTVLTASDDKPQAPSSVQRVIDYLGRHGITATHRDTRLRDGDIGHSLMASTTELGAGLLVMGAYGHSRLREFVFGGATKTVLQGRTVPVLLSH